MDDVHRMGTVSFSTDEGDVHSHANTGRSRQAASCGVELL
jgi:predicted metal-dependent enzyme (double-stranded beta helix superfamily)